MGSSLYNKIPLGRSSVLESAPVRAALLVGACVGLGLAWLLVRAAK